LADSQFLFPGEFAGDVIEHARDLIGRTLVVRSQDGSGDIDVLILETEAYGGASDPASHAAFRPGGRAALMSGAPGHIYIYAAYGMYPCLNIVTGPAGDPSAVLIRAGMLDGGRRITGPGRLTRSLGVTLADHGEVLCAGRFDVSRRRVPCLIRETPRIGITRGIDLPWRFLGDPVVEEPR
jgi:DNA-3-methyladenine glycosylase